MLFFVVVILEMCSNKKKVDITKKNKIDDEYELNVINLRKKSEKETTSTSKNSTIFCCNRRRRNNKRSLQLTRICIHTHTHTHSHTQEYICWMLMCVVLRLELTVDLCSSSSSNNSYYYYYYCCCC